MGARDKDGGRQREIETEKRPRNKISRMERPRKVGRSTK
jgi:hypothetical protein